MKGFNSTSFYYLRFCFFSFSENEHVPEPALDDANHYVQYEVLSVENMQHPESESLTS